MGIKSFKTDEQLEQKGYVLQYDTFRVTIARAGGSNDKFKTVFSRLAEPHERAMQHGLMRDETAKAIMHEAFAEAVVLNWETQVDGEWVQGIDFEDGEGLIEFNKTNVIRVFKEFPDLFAEIQTEASDASRFRASVREADAGN